MSAPAPRAERRSWLLVGAAAVLWGAAVGGIPLLSGGPGGDDGYYHAMRAQQHARCWRGGVLFPRWYPDLNGGLGGPEPRAYPLWPLTAHAALALLTDDGVAAVEVATVIVPILAGLTMLLVARRRGAGPGVALLSGAAWAASPYLVVALHERVALAECWALAILPWVLHALLPPAPRGVRGVAQGALAFAGLLATQLPLAFMVAIAVAVWQLVSGGRRRLLEVLAAGSVGSALAAASWLPNVVALRRLAGERLTGGGYDWRAHLLPGGAGGDHVLAGHLFLILAGVGLAAAIVGVFGGPGPRSLAVAGAISAVLATPLAWALYRWVPGFPLLQFPWRWLGLTSCVLTMALRGVGRRQVRAAAAVALMTPLLTAAAWRWRLPDGPPLRPADAGAQVAQAATRFGVLPILPSLPAYLPRGVRLFEALPAARLAAATSGPADPSGPREWRFAVSRATAGLQSFPLLTGPGWEATVDGSAAVCAERRSLLTVALPSGAHNVVFRQVLLAEDLAGGAVSVLATAGLLALAWRTRGRVPEAPEAREPRSKP